jgi:phosphoglycerate kinase
MKKIGTPSAKDVRNKTVMVRVDYNVPLTDEAGQLIVAEPERIENSLQTIRFLQKHNCRIILMSHLGRPDGEKKAELSLKPVANYLKTQLDLPTTFSQKTVGALAQNKAKKLKPQEILLLENLRFHPGEKDKDPKFSKQLADLAEVYINEAFSTAHRDHASMTGVPEYLPAFAGFHLLQEVEHLSNLMDNPQHPFVIVIGGAKISDKIEAVKNLDQIADIVLVGGGVANNFIKAEGLETHKSYLEETAVDKNAARNQEGASYVQMAKNLLEENKTERVLKDGYIPLPKLLYPNDVVAAKNRDSQKTQIIDLTHDMKDGPDDEDLMYLDIGPRTTKLYKELILQAETVFWSGPMGVFEEAQFAQGTKAVARTMAKSPARTVVGGGDTIAAVKKFSEEARFDYVSSAGGAALAFLAGKRLVGLEGVGAKS